MEAHEDCWLYADSAMMNTVIRNLVTNAVKFTHMGGSVVLMAENESHACRLSVVDNGVGMSEHTCSTLFKIDTKNSLAGTNNEQGTGLGLILCQDFVARHNGLIEVESRLGHGSRFVVTLPMD